MGKDIHAFVECDFQNDLPPFSSPSNIRCINTGEFFIWRNVELFHALGMDFYNPGLPRSPLVLGKIPHCLSVELIDQNGIIISPKVQTKTTTERLSKFPTTSLPSWQEQGLQYFEIDNVPDYYLELAVGETLLFDPGCELPNFVSAAEIRNAFEFCGVAGNEIEYFLAIVAMMDKFGQSLSPDHVRLLYWFDSVGPEFLLDYHSEHNIPNQWPIEN